MGKRQDAIAQVELKVFWRELQVGNTAAALKAAEAMGTSDKLLLEVRQREV